jgi:hypothetical protein
MTSFGSSNRSVTRGADVLATVRSDASGGVGDNVGSARRVQNVQLRAVYIAAYTVAWVAVAGALGFVVLVVWWLVAASAGQFACDGAWGPCGSVGRFTADYWWVIQGAAAVVFALAFLPLYRRLIRQTGIDETVTHVHGHPTPWD